MKHNKHFPTIIMVLTVFLTACSNDDNNHSAFTGDNAAIISTIAADYSDSDVQLVDLKNGLFSGTLTATSGAYSTGLSDFTTSAFGKNFYRIGRYNIDKITKYSLDEPTTEIYSYSTLDNASDPTSNPYKMVFLNETKAYLLRYNSNKIWIVNPSAISAAEFKTGEIDLSAYDDGDGSPEMADAVIVDGKLYVALERQNFYSVIAGNSYIAVIDTATDTEIIVNASAPLPGIQLQTNNPATLANVAGAGLLVQSTGSYGSWPTYVPEYIGGIEKINLTDYSTTVIVDDGDSTIHPFGLINGMAIVSPTVGYFIGYTAYGDNTLHQFNPSTGVVKSGNVAELGDAAPGDDIRSIEAGPNNTLWVSLADMANPRVLVINSTNNNIMDEIETTFNPTGVVFAKAE